MIVANRFRPQRCIPIHCSVHCTHSSQSAYVLHSTHTHAHSGIHHKVTVTFVVEQDVFYTSRNGPYIKQSKKKSEKTKTNIVGHSEPNSAVRIVFLAALHIISSPLCAYNQFIFFSLFRCLFIKFTLFSGVLPIAK